MATEKGLFWLALGVVALIFVNGTATGRQGWLGRLQNRSLELVERLSEHTMSYLSPAEVRAGNQYLLCPRTQATAARMQAGLACMEGAMARQQAEFARIQTQRARLEALQQMRFAEMPRHRNFVIAAPTPKSIPTEGTI